jgi:hypothetical protein
MQKPVYDDFPASIDRSVLKAKIGGFGMMFVGA